MKRKSENSKRGAFNLPFQANEVWEKRGKFSKREVGSAHNEPTASSQQHEAAGPGKSGAPKTSEYAFFKKLKKDAGGSGLSVVHEEGEQLKIFEPIGSTKAFTTKFKDNLEKIRSSIHHEKARVNSHSIFSSPQANAPKDLDAAQVEYSHYDIRSPFVAKNVTFSNQNLLLSPLGDAVGKSGYEDMDGDMLSQKRKRLRQWVAETSVPEVENLYSKGYDLVSILMNRLLPDLDQSKHRRDTVPTPGRANIKYSAVQFLHEDTYGENYRASRTRYFTEAEPISYLGDFCNKPREMIPLKLDSSLLNSPPTSQCLHNKFFLEDNYKEKSHWTKSRDRIEADPVWYLDDNFNKASDMVPLYLDTRSKSCDDRSKSYFSSRDPYFCSDIEVYESSSLGQIERNEFLAMDEWNYERGSDTMLLGWDFSNTVDKRDSSHTTCDKEMNPLSTLVAPSYNRHLSLGNRFGTHEPRSVFLNSDGRSEITLYPYSHLENLSNWDKRFSQEDNLLVSEFKQYPLPLPYVTKCIDISEDRDTCTSYEVDHEIAPQHTDWVITNILNEKHCSELKPLFPSGNDMDTFEKCSSSRELQSPQNESIYSFLLTDEQENFLYSSKDRQIRSLYTEDTINIHEIPLIDLHKPYGKEMVRPLLLESSSSWLRSVEGNDYDNG